MSNYNDSGKSAIQCVRSIVGIFLGEIHTHRINDMDSFLLKKASFGAGHTNLRLILAGNFLKFGRPWCPMGDDGVYHFCAIIAWKGIGTIL